MAETETSAFRDRDVDNYSQDETETRRWYVSRARRRDRDHNPALRGTVHTRYWEIPHIHISDGLYKHKHAQYLQKMCLCNAVRGWSSFD